jgi:two-component system NarL family sensor kinase
LRFATELFELETGWIWLLDEDTQVPYLAAARQLPPALEQAGLMDGQRYCYCLDSYQRGTLAGAANISLITCTRLKDLQTGTRGLTHHASIALNAHGRQLGVFNVVGADWRELSADDLRLLATVGDMLAIAIERARLFAHSAEIGAAEERSRLAREIHDTLAQGLSAIALQLEAADARLETTASADPARAAIGRALALAQHHLRDARAAVLDLRGTALAGRGLADALREAAEACATEHGLHLRFSAEVTRGIPQRIEAGLLRIAQEALTNVGRHARATTLAVQLLASESTVILLVDDDGAGFAPETVRPDRFGLTGMSERAHLLGARFDLQSAPGAGTRITLTCPL